jgi:hypothetical protein
MSKAKPIEAMMQMSQRVRPMPEAGGGIAFKVGRV